MKRPTEEQIKEFLMDTAEDCPHRDINLCRVTPRIPSKTFGICNVRNCGYAHWITRMVEKLWQ